MKRMLKLMCFSFCLMRPPCALCKHVSCFVNPLPSPYWRHSSVRELEPMRQIIAAAKRQLPLPTQGLNVSLRWNLRPRELETTCWSRPGTRHPSQRVTLALALTKPRRCCAIDRVSRCPTVSWDRKEGQRGLALETEASATSHWGETPSNGRERSQQSAIISTGYLPVHSGPRGQDGPQPSGTWVTAARKEEVAPEDTRQDTFRCTHYSQDSLE